VARLHDSSLGNSNSEASGGWCGIKLNTKCKIITLIAMKAELAKKWLGKLTKLNAATGSGKCRGKAPHKPLLLLCLLDMAEAGELAGRTFTRTAGLVLRFKSYGALVSERWPTRLDTREVAA